MCFGEVTQELTDLDKILGSIAKSGSKRRAADELATMWSSEQRRYKEHQSSLQLLESGAASKPAHTKTVTECPNCNEKDASKFSLTADKNEISCGSCGACIKKAAPKSNSFEKTPRADLHSTTRDGANSKADGVEDALTRTAMRLQELDSTVVRGSLKAAQTSIQKKAVRDTIKNDQKLTKAQSAKRDRIIVMIHTSFTACGRNPDSCAVCHDATSTANNLFLRCALHLSTCQHQKGCRCNVISASPKALAMECIRQALDHALLHDESQTCTAVGGKAAMQRVANELGPTLQSYMGQRNVSNQVGRRVTAVMEATGAELLQSCAKPEEEQADDDLDAAALANVPAPPSDDEEDDAPVNDIDMQRLQLSIQSIASIGWVEHKIVEKAIEFSMTPECNEWLRFLRAWPVDTVAMMLVCAFSTDKTAQNQLHLKQLCKQHTILYTTAATQLATLESMTRSSSSEGGCGYTAAPDEFGSGWS